MTSCHKRKPEVKEGWVKLRLRVGPWRPFLWLVHGHFRKGAGSGSEPAADCVIWGCIEQREGGLQRLSLHP